MPAALLALLLIAAAPEIALCPPDDHALEARIRGQVGDLDTRWIETPCTTTSSATVFVRGTADDGYRIELVRPGEPRRTKSLTPLSSASATREAAALAVRSLVKVVALGLEPDWPEEPPAPPPPPPPPTVAIARTTTATPTPWRGRASAGVEGQMTGLGDPRASVTLRGGARFDALVFEAGGRFGLSRTLRDDNTALRLSEHELFAALGWRVWADGPFAATAGIRGGIAIARRQTEALLPNVTATPDETSVAGLAGLEARMSYRFVELLAGVDLPIGAPRLLYRRGDELVERASAWPVRARIGLLFTFETGD